MMVDGFKKAALKLYTLGAADREWILGQLDERERKTLRTLMTELKNSGIKPIFLPFDEIVDQPLPPAAAPSRPKVEGAEEILMSLSSPEADRLLADESDWVVSVICNARPWPWRSAFMQRLPAVRRRRVQEEADAAAVKPALLVLALEAAAEKWRTHRRHGEVAPPRTVPGMRNAVK
jgi:hypothetical protein